MCIGLYKVKLYSGANLEIGNFEERTSALLNNPSLKSHWADKGEVVIAMSDHSTCVQRQIVTNLFEEPLETPACEEQPVCVPD